MCLLVYKMTLFTGQKELHKSFSILILAMELAAQATTKHRELFIYAPYFPQLSSQFDLFSRYLELETTKN